MLIFSTKTENASLFWTIFIKPTRFEHIKWNKKKNAVHVKSKLLMTREEFLSNVLVVMSTKLYDAQDAEVTLLNTNVQTVALKDQTN